jgi:cytochrome c oxidase subunit IV
VNLSLVVQASGLTWSKVFVPGFILACLGMGVSYLVEVFGTQGKEELSTERDGAETPVGPLPESEKGAGGGRIIHMLFVAGSFVLATAVLEWLHVGAASGRTVLAGALIVICWILSQARRPGMKEALKTQWLQGTLKVADIAPFFVAMGVFSGALEVSGLLERAAPFLKSAAGSLGAASIVFIALGILAGSIVGLHPFITIVLFGKVLALMALPVPPITVALSLAVGGAAAYMVTPFAGVIMTISRLIDTKAVDVALRWNWRFSLLFLAAGLLYAFGWGAVFG